MEIRRLVAGDEDTYRELRLRALGDAPRAFGSTLERELAFAPDAWTRRLTDPGTVNLLAVEDGMPAGMGSGLLDDPGTAYLVGMWVAPEARGRGVGGALIDAIAGWAHERGARHLALWVADENASARMLYERHGFRSTGERQPLPSDMSLMATKLRRPVASGPPVRVVPTRR